MEIIESNGKSTHTYDVAKIKDCRDINTHRLRFELWTEDNKTLDVVYDDTEGMQMDVLLRNCIDFAKCSSIETNRLHHFKTETVPDKFHEGYDKLTESLMLGTASGFDDSCWSMEISSTISSAHLDLTDTAYTPTTTHILLSPPMIDDMIYLLSRAKSHIMKMRDKYDKNKAESAQ